MDKRIARRVIVAALSAFFGILGYTDAQTNFTNQFGAGDGRWFNPLNWSNGLPATGNDANIFNGSTVTIDQPLTANFNIVSYGKIVINNNVRFVIRQNFSSFTGSEISCTGTFVNEKYFDLKGKMAVDSFLNQATAYALIDGLVAKMTALVCFENRGTIDQGACLVNAGKMINFAGAGFINRDSVLNRGTFDNRSNFSNISGARFINTGTATVVAGTNFINEGFVENSSQFTNNGTVSIVAVFQNKTGGTLTNAAGAQLNVNNQLDNAGVIVNNGLAVVLNIFNNTASFTNTNAFQNAGTVNNRASGTIINAAAALWTNLFGSVLLNEGSFTSTGSIESVGSIQNKNQFNNGGFLRSNSGGAIANDGVFQNTDSLLLVNGMNNKGSFTNNAFLQNLSGSVIENNNSFVNAAGGRIVNQFEIVNKNVFSNLGLLMNGLRFFNQSDFQNNGTIDNTGDLTNELGATLANRKIFNNNSGGIFENKGTTTNFLTYLNNDCAATINRGTLQNSGIFENYGVLYRFSPIGGTAVQEFGLVITGPTSTALCHSDTIGLKPIGTQAVYGTTLVNELIDTCMNFLFFVDDAAVLDFDCDDHEKTFPVTMKLQLRNGLATTCDCSFTIVDNLGPNFLTAPKDTLIAVPAGTTSKTVNWTTPTLEDNCNGVKSVSATHTSGAAFPLGTTNVRYTAFDNLDNQSFHDFRITIVDELSLFCRGDLRFQCSSTDKTVITWDTPKTVTPCNGGVTLRQIGGPAKGSEVAVGNYTIQYRATDNCGGSVDCSFAVEVTCSKVFFTNCPNDIVQDFSNNPMASWTPPTATTSCRRGLKSITQIEGPVSGSTFPIGVTNIVYVAEDNCGFRDTCRFSVTINSVCANRVNGGLLAFYDFSEGSGNVVRDRSGTGAPLDLTIPDLTKVSWLAGGNGVSIKASTLLSSATAATKITNAVKVSNAITVEAWVRPDNATQSGPARIVTISKDPYNRNAMLGQSGSSYIGRFRTTTVGNNGTPDLTSAGGSVTAGQLQHVVYTKSTSGVEKIYVNGVEKASSTRSGNASNWDATFKLGLANEITLDRPWLGEIYMVAIYDKALSTAEVAQNKNVGPRCAGNVCTTSAAVSDIVCNNNGTPSVTTDDTYTFSLLVSGSGNGTWTATAAGQTISGTIGTAKTVGPLAISAGVLNMKIESSIDGAKCAATATVTPPAICSTGNPPLTCSGGALTNHSFESNLTGWENWGNTTTTSSANSGSKAAKIGAGAGGFGQISSIVPTAGMTVVVKAFAKIEGTVSWAGFGVDFLDVNKVEIPNTEAATTVRGNSYSEHTAVKIIPAGTKFLRFWTWSDGTAGYLYLDDICMTIVPTVSTCAGNLLANDNFDLNLAGWDNWTNTTISSNAYSGTKAARIGAGQGGFGQYPGIVVTPGATVMIKFRAKIEGSPSWAGADVDFLDDDWEEIPNTEIVRTVTATGYTEYSFSKTIPSGTKYLGFWAWKNGSSGYLYLDDICLTVSQPPAGCNKTVLFVVGNTSLSSADAAYKQRLQNLGFTVTTVNDDNVTAAMAADKGLVFVSSSSLSTTVGTKFKSISTPVLTNEDALFDELGMSSNKGTTGSYQNINITNSSHPLAAGLSGKVQVYTSDYTMTYQTFTNGGTQVATLPGASSQSVIVGYEKGSQMNGFTAPARRTAIFLYDNSPSYLTANGWKLFDAAVNWTAGCSTTTGRTSAEEVLTLTVYPVDQQKVRLEWANNTGYKNDRFTIERSASGEAFEPVAEYLAHIETTENQLFKIEDDNPVIGVNTYRVRLDMLDGAVRYSNEVAVEIKEKADFRVSPNPAHETVRFYLDSLKDKTAIVEIYNALGHLMQSLEIEEVTEAPIELDIHGLTDGVYTVLVKSGGILRGKKLVISKL